MGFFNNKKETEISASQSNAQPIKPTQQVEVSRDNIKTPTSNLSVLRDSFKVKANIDGKGSLIIGGEYEGEITIDDTLFIEKGAKFSGSVKAKNVKISGEFSGTIYSSVFEVTPSGKFSGNINTNKSFLGGKIDGIVRSIDSIEITKSGSVDTKECKSKQIKVEGKVKGRVVASELLEVTSGGSIEGDIITKGIRTEQGGTIIGNIQTYDENLHGNSQLEAVAKQTQNDSAVDLDPEISKLININADDMKKYARKDDDKGIKRIPPDKK